jgi:signal transduction histidine kinase
MLMPASSEFVALCQSQVGLLTEGLGAALSIVYLTEELTEVTDAKMVPVVAYPEAVAGWGEEQILSLLSRGSYRRDSEVRSLQSANALPQFTLLPTYLDSDYGDYYSDYGDSDHTDGYSSAYDDSGYSRYGSYNPGSRPLEAAERALSRQQQIVLPIIHEEVVMGLLVTARADRAWTNSEQEQIEQIAKALALGCVLDQRSQWLLQDSRQQRLFREQRRDLFDNLLHQFRNPLTAMRTFGKLLTRRIRPEDANHAAAEGIVRESDRLQELLKQFDAAIDLDETDLRQLLSAADSDNPEVARPELIPHTPPLLSAGAILEDSASGSTSGSNILIGSSLHLETCSIAEVLNPMLESAMAIAQDRQLELNTDLPAHLPLVQMDRRALREVLSNLIDNALKYTPAHGTVDVIVQRHLSTDASGNRQTIAILDNGPGIPSQDLEHLFERHYRGVQAATDIPGTGLGLAIARELVQQMQGEIKVFSPAHTCRLTLSHNADNQGADEQGADEQGAIAHGCFPGTAVTVSLLEASAVDLSSPDR